MLNNKLSRESKKFYERELRQYWKNKEKLGNLLSKKEKQLQNDYTSCRTIIYLQEHIDYIETVIRKMKPTEKEIFEMIFKENLDWQYCKTKRNIDKNTYYNIFNKSIYLLAEEFGEI